MAFFVKKICQEFKVPEMYSIDEFRCTGSNVGTRNLTLSEPHYSGSTISIFPSCLKCCMISDVNSEFPAI